MNQNTGGVPLLLEIGTEDIPARFIPIGMQQLKENAETIFQENNITVSGIKVYGTPRRLALLAEKVSTQQEARAREFIGPAKKIAFDENNNPTKAAIGFAKSQGITVDQLKIKQTEKGEYVAAILEEKSSDVKELLPDILKKIIYSMRFPKSMRWGNYNMRFVRPIRWLLTLFNNEIINIEVEGIKSSSLTRGHRFLSPEEFQIKESANYENLLSDRNVIVSPEERKRKISEKLDEISASVNGKVIKDENLMQTVSNLVEYPVPVLGKFPAVYLTLPKELLITVMKEHQKYFAIEDSKGKLTDNFIVISNTIEDNRDTIKIGAERVIKARFEDAKFYFEEDRKKKLSDRIEELKQVVYQEQLGTLYEKTLRIKDISAYISKKLNPALKQQCERASLLAKTDLITGVVREFPELQGITGKYYALSDKEDAEVAAALEEQYFHGDKIPDTEIGTILSLADKTDNITAFFSIGLVPTGSEDPFALRRQALSVTAIITERKLDITIEELISCALENLKLGKKEPEIKSKIIQFFEQRFEPLFSSQGYSQEVIQSVLSYSTNRPLKEIKKLLDSIEEVKNRNNFIEFLTAIKRVKNIIPSAKLPVLKPKLFSTEPEKKLHTSLAEIKKLTEIFLKKHEYPEAIETILPLKDSINHFFDNVMVMDKKEAVKMNRLALLNDVWQTASLITDFSKL